MCAIASFVFLLLICFLRQETQKKKKHPNQNAVTQKTICYHLIVVISLAFSLSPAFFIQSNKNHISRVCETQEHDSRICDNDRDKNKHFFSVENYSIYSCCLSFIHSQSILCTRKIQAKTKREIFLLNEREFQQWTIINEFIAEYRRREQKRKGKK